MNYSNILKRNNLKVNKVTIKGKVTIIDTPLGLFVIKKNIGIKKYNYLLSRNFNYIPKIIDYDDDVILFEYIEGVDYTLDEKAHDYIKLLSLLHLKTTYFKEIDSKEYKDIYEVLKQRIDDLNSYYNNITNIIENNIYMSPSEYLLIRNISIILSCINYCNNELENWYKTNKNNNKKRVSTLYNNINLNNMIKSKDKTYFIDFDSLKTDMPIYDLINFYNKYFDKFDFNSLLKLYEKNYPLNNEEKELLFIIISIPDKITINNSINNISIVKKAIDKIYITLNFLNFEKEESRKTHKKEDNKQ